ncbi:FAD binding domain-containing protein [Boeremia exigua]|uniref:FAD binding domain-containing protein n=1 Tax=Boeremia exigua TaxID=749465 RepID=UPI001E8E8518|nr:FAD binding domain-containing protein [Boeremia exigua]KAH6612113.1 FAD binding domain-containing protein [Boeremia exigua]
MVRLAMKVSLLAALVLSPAAAVSAETCRCGPDDSCWPPPTAWAALNSRTDGRLIKSTPLAESCYPGPKEDRAQCDYVRANWPVQAFHVAQPLGLAHPWDLTCPPVDYAAGESAGSCSLGQNPRYAVNVTAVEHIRAALAFAARRNVRLVVKSTGHDLLGRSDGYGSLELWLHYFRSGIGFQSKYASSDKCAESGWKESAIKIGGAYQWIDVYVVAKQNNVIVVGGGAPSVGAVGGWNTGGGHGPATRNYGMGADQILEAEVMLANGRIVTASACQNTDLYRALRGGGPGYGVILSMTVKAHPNVHVVSVQRLELAPKTANASAVLDAVTLMFQSLPDLNDAGFAGYAYWAINAYAPLFGNTTAGYHHSFWNIGNTTATARAAFAPIRARLNALNATIHISESYTEYPDYWSMYAAESSLNDPVGTPAALSSRLLDRASVSNTPLLRSTLATIIGPAEEFGQNTVLLVTRPRAPDAFSGLHPAWHTSHFLSIVGRGWPAGSPAEVQAYIRSDVTNVKGKALKELAPHTGGYVNEGDRLDGEWQRTFHGKGYAGHLKTKRRVDPEGLFYCAVCVGSEGWIERADAPLCRV